MVCSRVRVFCAEVSRIPEMMRWKSCGTWLFMKWELVWRTLIKELVLGFHWLEITSANSLILIKYHQPYTPQYTSSPCLIRTSSWSQLWILHIGPQNAHAKHQKAELDQTGRTQQSLVDFLPLRGAFTAAKAIRNLGHDGQQCHMLYRGVCDSTFVSTTGLLGSQPFCVNYNNNPYLRIGWIVMFGGPWVSKEIWSEVLLPTDRAEALPLLAPTILLGVVLPELGSLGGGERMVTNWLLGGGGGGDINAERHEKWTLPVKIIFWQEVFIYHRALHYVPSNTPIGEHLFT